MWQELSSLVRHLLVTKIFRRHRKKTRPLRARTPEILSRIEKGPGSVVQRSPSLPEASPAPPPVRTDGPGVLEPSVATRGTRPIDGPGDGETEDANERRGFVSRLRQEANNTRHNGLYNCV